MLRINWRRKRDEKIVEREAGGGGGGGEGEVSREGSGGAWRGASRWREHGQRHRCKHWPVLDLKGHPRRLPQCHHRLLLAHFQPSSQPVGELTNARPAAVFPFDTGAIS